MTRIAGIATAAALLSACAGGAPEAAQPAPQAALAHEMPTTMPLTYTSSDSMTFDIEMGPGQTMEQTMGQSSRVTLSFAPAAGSALTVTADVSEAAMYMGNMMGRQEIPGDALTGTYTFTLVPTGEVEMLESPDLPEEAQQLMGEDRFRDFFPRLPGRAVQPGQTWVDTVTAESETEVGTTTNRSIITSTFRGDTTVNGRTLWVVDAVKDVSVELVGETQGMEIRQELAGSATETIWWDPVRRLMLSSVSTGTMSGSLSMPAAGMTDIPVDASMHRRIQLVEGAP